jgi:hypothetical protein
MVTDPTLWSTKAPPQCARRPGRCCASYENHRRFLVGLGKKFTAEAFLHRRHTWSHAPGVSFKVSADLPGVNGDRSDLVVNQSTPAVRAMARETLCKLQKPPPILSRPGKKFHNRGLSAQTSYGVPHSRGVQKGIRGAPRGAW